MKTLTSTLVALLALAHGVPSTAWATPPGSDAAAEALALCRAADGHEGREQEEILARGSRVAEAVLAADDNDAAAHFALFCNEGKRMQRAGLRFGSLFVVQRLRREIDRAEELAPDDPDVLIAKGALLLSLPRLLGGDADEAQRLLRKALASDPQNGFALAYLSRAGE